MTTTSAPTGLTVDPAALADVCASLLRTAARLQDSGLLTAPDTGASAAATRRTWTTYAARVERTATEMRTLGRRLDAFVDLTIDVDDRTRAELDRVRGGSPW